MEAANQIVINQFQCFLEYDNSIQRRDQSIPKALNELSEIFLNFI